MLTGLFKRNPKGYSDFLSWAKCHIPCVKDEFLKKGIRTEYPKAVSLDIQYRTEVYFRLESPLFYRARNVFGIAFVATHLANHDCSMLEIVMYSKHGYKASSPVLSFKTADELLEWLGQKNTPEECSQTLDELLSILESEK